MDFPHPPVTATVGGQPIHAMLIPFPFVCFTLTLLTDIAYWQTGHLMWHNFSSWLLFAGLIFGGFALLAGLAAAYFNKHFKWHQASDRWSLA